MLTTRITVIAALLGYAKVALAGAGANVYGCVNLDNAPNRPLFLTFTPQNEHCMNPVGMISHPMIENAGMTCIPLGYVEADSKDNCYFEKSHWKLSFDVGSGRKSGFMYSRWRTQSYLGTGNYIELEDRSPGTSVCKSDAPCSGNMVTWPTGEVGKYYFQFKLWNPNALLDEIDAAEDGSQIVAGEEEL